MSESSARSGMPVFLSAETAEAVFDWESAVRSIQAAYGEPFSASALPPRAIARDGGTWLRSLPAMPPGGRYFGAKLMALSSTAEQPGAEYVTVLFDRQTSSIAAFVDAAVVTGYRTAATSAAAVDRLAPAGPARLGVLGSGLEAAMHIRAFAAIRPLSEVVIYSTTAAKREGLAATLTAELNVPCRAAERPEAVAEHATIVLAAARSHGEQPILFGDWLQEGTTIVSIGSTVSQQREVDISVVAKADLIICDTVEEVQHETGDMIAAAEAGITFAERAYSLNALIRGELSGPVATAKFPMFKSVGGGIQDVIVAEMLLTRALVAGLATPLPMHFVKKTRS